MDGENNGKPYEQMDDLGISLFLETPSWFCEARFWVVQLKGLVAFFVPKKAVTSWQEIHLLLR